MDKDKKLTKVKEENIRKEENRKNEEAFEKEIEELYMKHITSGDLIT
ncbi:MAG: hypothetical protein N4A62_00850 [Marinisporobacter sp.]|jgi:hypothetical protein|nr:hypothetical protein [Marinisporobacter sp.]